MFVIKEEVTYGTDTSTAITTSTKAIDAIVDVFKGVDITAPIQFYTNPIFSLTDTHILDNTGDLQRDLPTEYRSNNPYRHR